MIRSLVGISAAAILVCPPTAPILLGAPATAARGQSATSGEQTGAGVYLDPVNGMSARELAAMALERNDGYLAVRQMLDETRGLGVQAGLKPNPTLDVNAANGAVLGSPGEREFSVGYSHVFERGGKRTRRLERAGIGERLAETEVRERERQIRAEIEQRFAEALAAGRNFEIADSLLKLNQHSLEIAEARYRQGEAARLEPGMLKVEVGRMQADRLRFESQARQAVADLKLLAGMAAAEPLRLKGSLATPAISITEAEAIAMALGKRPDLAAAACEEELGDSEIRLAKADATPDVTATGRYTQSAARFDQFGLSGTGSALEAIRTTDNTLSVGLSIQLPVRNRNQGNIQAAIARRNAARLRRSYLEQTVRRDVANAYSRYGAAMRAVRIFDEDVLKQAQENVATLRTAYDAGELRLLDVINEQGRLIETQRAYTEVLREAYLSLADLERAIGAPVF
ncbi:MAG: TolC family protein [Bryobacterales bacterium]|nr:TolC family protein [Bryobacterales bacterium]